VSASHPKTSNDDIVAHLKLVAKNRKKNGIYLFLNEEFIISQIETE